MSIWYELVKRFRAPPLPKPGLEYTQSYMDNTVNVLRLYFNQLDEYVNNLGRAIEATSNDALSTAAVAEARASMALQTANDARSMAELAATNPATDVIQVLSVAGGGGSPVVNGRITLTSGVPVTTADVTSATTVFFTPYGGDLVTLWSGTQWVTFAFSETTLSLGTLVSGTNYDVFAYWNAGSLALELGTAWASNTTRATALQILDGRYCKTGDRSRLYLGTLRTTSTTTTEDSAQRRLVWNYYNRAQRAMQVLETTDQWTYNTNAWRQANGNAANQLEVVVGIIEDACQIDAVGVSVHSGSLTFTVGTGIGINSSTVASGIIGYASCSNSINGVARASVRHVALGFTEYRWLERASGTPTHTWFGDAGDSTRFHNGIIGTMFA